MTCHAEMFWNGEFVTGRCGGDGWLLSTFLDGSILASVEGIQRSSETISHALDYWRIQHNNAVPHGSRYLATLAIINALEELRDTAA